ncbi:Transcription initiation factor TFIID subunit 12 [Armadillidium nasatum]|uniref:Transcription initiation factor TFIID subunit 12 n=1 Tax=Armadillidium nasatum TaxID=96803 RepID=A0A5N5TE89_9CRUS|nr:Transcription initiation factor TFIID subunit 12 [Armadillidium nasatum]
MSQPVQQMVGVQGQVIQGQIVQGQVVQGQMVPGGQVTTGQMVMTSASNLTTLPQQQIVTQLVSGQTVQGTIGASTVGTTTITPGQVVGGQTVGEVQQIVAAASTTGVQHVVCGQQVGTVQQVAQPQLQAAATVTNHNSVPQPVKQTVVTQAVPPPSPTIGLSENSPPVISKQRMAELVREVDPNEQLDEDVEELLMSIADDFIESTVNAACRLAKHRGSRTLEVKDIQMYLEKNWHMWIPGFGTEELKPYKRAPTTEAHKAKVSVTKKSC